MKKTRQLHLMGDSDTLSLGNKIEQSPESQYGYIEYLINMTNKTESWLLLTTPHILPKCTEYL